jgi:hypothetical protein
VSCCSVVQDGEPEVSLQDIVGEPWSDTRRLKKTHPADVAAAEKFYTKSMGVERFTGRALPDVSPNRPLPKWRLPRNTSGCYHESLPVSLLNN